MRFVTTAAVLAALAVPTIGAAVDAAPTCPSTRPRTDRSLTLIRTEDAAIPSSPISQAVISGDHLYVSGFLPLAPHTGELVSEGDVVAQTHAVLDNIKTIIEHAGSDLGKVVKVTLYMKNIDDYGTVNEIYADFFGTHRPARSAIAAADIPLGVLVEIDMIARL
ncbi:putative endoribonuclease L-PSP [Lyophyllum shimeji]|uniref:Endoribonuclease L-PSP n=1 Tax=Lyophyllum shimeji TaxID=47721 RepID=A0A9P3PM04_LYOSH|nr:putative endoribonuclease L-PSP [Lyophyllum shimeji]